jgi:hypothetical protein
MAKRYKKTKNGQRLIPGMEDFSLLSKGTVAHGKEVANCPKCGHHGLKAVIQLEGKKGWVEYWHKGFVNDFGGLTIRQLCSGSVEQVEEPENAE